MGMKLLYRQTVCEGKPTQTKCTFPSHDMTSGEDAALPLHVVAPPRSLSRRTDDEPTRARDLRECSERSTEWYLWINGRRSCDDEQGARDP